MYTTRFDWRRPSSHKLYWQVDFPSLFLNRHGDEKEVVVPRQDMEDWIFEGKGNVANVHCPNSISGSVRRDKGEMTVLLCYKPKPGIVVKILNIVMEVFSISNEEESVKTVQEAKHIGGSNPQNGIYSGTTPVNFHHFGVPLDKIYRARMVFNFQYEADPVVKVGFEPSSGNTYFQKTYSDACSHFRDYLESATYSDFTLVAEDEKEFPVHRVILARESDLFKKVFDGSFKEKEDGRVNIPASSNTLNAVLRWVYTNSSKDADNYADQELLDLYMAADYCQVMLLKEWVHAKILGNMSMHNAVHLLEFANGRQNGDSIAKAALEVIKRTKQDIFKTHEMYAEFQKKFPKEAFELCMSNVVAEKPTVFQFGGSRAK